MYCRFVAFGSSESYKLAQRHTAALFRWGRGRGSIHPYQNHASNALHTFTGRFVAFFLVNIERFWGSSPRFVRGGREPAFAPIVKMPQMLYWPRTRRHFFLMVSKVTSLLSYTRPERLSGDNQYFCDRCESKQDALRSQTLTALPPLLIFSLNRWAIVVKSNAIWRKAVYLLAGLAGSSSTPSRSQ